MAIEELSRLTCIVFFVSVIRNIPDPFCFFVRKLAKSNVIFGLWHLNKRISIVMMVNCWF